jgi:hypothetical protein
MVSGQRSVERRDSMSLVKAGVGYLALVVGSNGFVVLRLELVGLGYIGSLVLQLTGAFSKQR